MKLFKAIEVGAKYAIMLFIIIFISYVIGKMVDKLLRKFNLPKPLHNSLDIICFIAFMILAAYILKPIYYKIF